MSTPAFIITIDTEGDNLWARPERVTTENARFLPRFQDLCEAHGFHPTYLVTHEMALDRRFQTFGREVLRRGAGEIGMHLHAWSTPPLDGPSDPRAPHLYLYELSDGLLSAKVASLSNLLAQVFEVRPRSHRAGKWGLDERVAHVLIEVGILTDCSVTPGISWRRFTSTPGGRGGPDYRGFPTHPYFVDSGDIRRAGASPLLEVPLTVIPTYGGIARAVYGAVRGSRAAAGVVHRLMGPPHLWLRPDGRNLPTLLRVVEMAAAAGFPVLEFMLHSSELMPGGSPTFSDVDDVEGLYADLGVLFAAVQRLGARGMTLDGYRATRRPAAARVGLERERQAVTAAGDGRSG